MRDSFTKHRNRRQHVGALVEKIAKPVFKKHGFAETKLLMAWPEIVGAALAQVSTPIRLQFTGSGVQGGSLHVRVKSAWALEIQHMEPLILDKISTYFGYRAVERLKIMQSATAGIPLSEINAQVKKKAVKPEIEDTESVDDILNRMRELVE